MASRKLTDSLFHGLRYLHDTAWDFMIKAALLAVAVLALIALARTASGQDTITGIDETPTLGESAFVLVPDASLPPVERVVWQIWTEADGVVVAWPDAEASGGTSQWPAVDQPPLSTLPKAHVQALINPGAFDSRTASREVDFGPAATPPENVTTIPLLASESASADLIVRIRDNAEIDLSAANEAGRVTLFPIQRLEVRIELDAIHQRLDNIDSMLSQLLTQSNDKPPDKPPRPESPIDLNIADASLLQSLPGIGPALSNRIVATRVSGGPFTDLQSISDRVRGLGESSVNEWVILNLIQDPRAE